MRSPGAAGKNARGCKCTVPSVRNLLFKQEHAVRRKDNAGPSGRIDGFRNAAAGAHPPWVGGIESFVPYGAWNVAKPRLAILEIEEHQHFVAAVPSADAKNGFLLDADDIERNQLRQPFAEHPVSNLVELVQRPLVTVCAIQFRNPFLQTGM